MPNNNDLEDDLNDDLPEDDILDDNDNVDPNDDDNSDDLSDSKNQNLTPEQIADLAAQTAMRVQPRQQQQIPQLSPEELDARLNRYKVNADFVKLLRDPEAQPEKLVEAFQAMLDGTAKHAVTSSQFLYQNDLGPIQQKLQAQEAFVREQQTRTFVKNVGSQYPSLAKYDQVIRQATTLVSQSGYIPKSHSDARRQVALQAQQIIRQIDPQFSLKANPARQASGFSPRRSSYGGGQNVPAKTGAGSFADYLR
jgi:hypothetical protein